MSLVPDTISESAFFKQVAAIREALLNFAIISQLNAPGPIKLAMEHLVDVTVSRSFIFCLYSSDSEYFAGQPRSLPRYFELRRVLAFH